MTQSELKLKSSFSLFSGKTTSYYTYHKTVRLHYLGYFIDKTKVTYDIAVAKARLSVCLQDPHTA